MPSDTVACFLSYIIPKSRWVEAWWFHMNVPISTILNWVDWDPMNKAWWRNWLLVWFRRLESRKHIYYLWSFQIMATTSRRTVSRHGNGLITTWNDSYPIGLKITRSNGQRISHLYLTHTIASYLSLACNATFKTIGLLASYWGCCNSLLLDTYSLVELQLGYVHH